MRRKKLNITKIIEEELEKIEKAEGKDQMSEEERRERLAEMIDDHESSIEHLKMHPEEEKALRGFEATEEHEVGQFGFHPGND